MEYFSHPTPSDTATATCEDVECPCPKQPFESGSGYLYVSNRVIRQHRRGSDGETTEVPILLCRDAARRRDIDLDVAAEDAAHWWKTGSVGLRATPRRELKFKEFTGTSVEDAERQAQEDIAELIGTEVISKVREATATAQGGSVEAAMETIRPRIHKDAFDVSSPVVIQEGQSGEIKIEETDESEAKRSWRKQAPRGAQLVELDCVQAPKSGVLGMGKRRGTWIARWSAPFIVEVTYKLPAVVSARFFS